MEEQKLLNREIQHSDCPLNPSRRRTTICVKDESAITVRRMSRVIQKVLAVVVLAVGLTMIVWGWRAFDKIEPASPPPDEDEIRICPPTLGEMIEIGPVGRKLGCLVIAVAGMAVAGSSFLNLIRRREQT
jgi:hypothetical protein